MFSKETVAERRENLLCDSEYCGVLLREKCRKNQNFVC